VENNITMPRLKALQEEWQRNPPLLLMVAAYLGIKNKEEGSPEELLEKIIGMEHGSAITL